jgi:hypothetical protein
VADEHDGAVDLALVVQAVHVASHTCEQAPEDASVRLALVGEVGELALGEHGAAARDGDAAGTAFRKLHRFGERPAEPRAQPFDRLTGAGRAAFVGFVAHAATGVAGKHGVAPATDAHDIEGSVRIQPGGGGLLRDLFGQAAERRLAEPVAVDTRRGHPGQPREIEPPVHLEERA